MIEQDGQFDPRNDAERGSRDRGGARLITTKFRGSLTLPAARSAEGKLVVDRQGDSTVQLVPVCCTPEPSLDLAAGAPEEEQPAEAGETASLGDHRSGWREEGSAS